MLDILFFSLRAQVQPKPPSGSVGWLSALMNCSSGSLYCPLKLANYEMITDLVAMRVPKVRLSRLALTRGLC